MANNNVALKSTVENLPNNSKVQGFTKLLTITASMLAAYSAADDTVTFTVPIAPKSLLSNVLLDLITPFSNTADNTNNSTTAQVGDTAGATTFVTAAELNANGANVTMKAMTGTQKVYTAADTLKILVTPKTGTALSVLNQGELRVYLRVAREGEIG